MNLTKGDTIRPTNGFPLGFTRGASSDLLRHQSHGVRTGYGKGHSCSGYKYTNLGKSLGHSQELHYHYTNSGYSIGERCNGGYKYDNLGKRI